MLAISQVREDCGSPRAFGVWNVPINSKSFTKAKSLINFKLTYWHTIPAIFDVNILMVLLPLLCSVRLNVDKKIFTDFSYIWRWIRGGGGTARASTNNQQRHDVDSDTTIWIYSTTLSNSISQKNTKNFSRNVYLMEQPNTKISRIYFHRQQKTE